MPGEVGSAADALGWLRGHIRKWLTAQGTRILFPSSLDLLFPNTWRQAPLLAIPVSAYELRAATALERCCLSESRLAKMLAFQLHAAPTHKPFGGCQ